jgi:uncharacterized glyoxalase superfamily protein PhnB
MARSKKAARAASRKKSAARPKKKAVAKAARTPARAAKARKPSRPKKAQAVPAAYGSLTPHLIVSPASEAIAFYVKAFGARPGLMMDGPGGIVMHAEVKIGDSILMLADEQPPMGTGPTRKSPKNLGGTTAGVMLYVKDTDAAYARAVAAGAIGLMPPMDMFWGDRYCQIEDPFGHIWAIGTHLKDMTARQMKQAALTAMPPPPQA